jgi:hypothetical protein
VIAAADIANDPVLAPELVFRGGTCFHKLWLERPWRYSEDLDYVRTTAGGVGDVLTTLRSIAQRIVTPALPPTTSLPASSPTDRTDGAPTAHSRT